MRGAGGRGGGPLALNSEFVLGRMNYAGVPLSDVLSSEEMSWGGTIGSQLLFWKKGGTGEVILKFCLREEVSVTKIFIFGSNVNVNKKNLNAVDNDRSNKRSWNSYAETNVSRLLPSGILCSLGW